MAGDNQHVGAHVIQGVDAERNSSSTGLQSELLIVKYEAVAFYVSVAPVHYHVAHAGDCADLRDHKIYVYGLGAS